MRNRFDLLSLDDKHPDDMWAEIKGSVIDTALKHVPYKKPAKAGQWLTSDTIRIADKRREAKAKGKFDEARQLKTLTFRRKPGKTRTASSISSALISKKPTRRATRENFSLT